MRRGFILAIVLVLPIPIFAQIQIWVARYNGPANAFDGAYAIAVDGAGNIYVTGGSNGASSDYATIKYNSSGDTLWVRRYDGPSNSGDVAFAIAVDGAGNVYVTGISYGSGTDYDYATIKYNSSGVEQWTRRYDGPSNSSDRAKAIAVDGSGNVYVTGYSFVSGLSDYATIKYNSSGDTLWVRRYDGPREANDEATAIAVDGSGNVYVTGTALGLGTNYEGYATVKYNNLGEEQWVRRYDGLDYHADSAYAIAVDGAGNVYVTGVSERDYATVKYNTLGEEQWVRRYETGGDDDGASAIAVDGAGNVYVTGESKGDYATIKYNSSGVEQWVRRYDGPGNSCAAAIAVDGVGDVYVTGKSWGSGTYYDYATIKYNTDGVEQWVERYNGPGNDIDLANAIAVDGSGNVYVTGRSEGSGTDYDYATIKYSGVPAIEVIPDTLKFSYTGTKAKGSIDTLIYDDGTPQSGYHWGPGKRMASRMSPTDGCKILAVQIYCDGAQFYKVGIYNWIGSAPGNEFLESSTVLASGGGWNTTDVSSYNVNVTGDFIASFNMIDTLAILGYDASDNGRAWDYDGSWSAWTGTYFIRAIVEYGGGPTGDTIKIMKVQNGGGANLVVSNITGNQSWITHISPASFTVAPGDYQDVTVTVTKNGLSGGTHYGYLTILSNDPDESSYIEPVKFVTEVGVEETPSLTPQRFKLSQNSPNPFIQSTIIKYQLPVKSKVSLKVYDLTGRLVRALVQGNREAGYHSVNWNGKDDSGKRVAKGTYFYRMEAGEFKATRKLTIIR